MQNINIAVHIPFTKISTKKIIDAINKAETKSMIEAAKEKNVDLAITSSELDNSDSFNRILTKQGWIKRNKSLIYPIN